MSIEEKEQAIKDFFVSRFKTKVLIIVGSRAVGDYKPRSDWDIYSFTDEEKKDDEYADQTAEELFASYPPPLHGEDLDISLNSMDVDSYSAKLWRDLRNSKVILDNEDGFGEKLREKALDMYNRGPVKWSKVYAQWRPVKARRYMKKFEDNLKDKNYLELFLRFSWHYSENVINWWFGIRQEFPLRPQQAFPYIKEQDPNFYKELQIIVAENTNYEEKIEAFREIHKMLFESDAYKQLI